ncbi:MAG TPA: hypothetical protein VES40_11105 [Ilumatobacteraceae bacterium]|nr:hypothetical protein [Ilumatobacteraceae bacterium]
MAPAAVLLGAAATIRASAGFVEREGRPRSAGEVGKASTSPMSEALGINSAMGRAAFKTHVSNILGKLGLTNRTQIATEALRQQDAEAVLDRRRLQLDSDRLTRPHLRAN